MSAPTTLADVHALREAYVYSVNSALEHGREDVARELADTYADEALSALTSIRPGR